MARTAAPFSVVKALFPRLRAREFVERYFPNRPLVTHGPLSRFGELAHERRLLTPESLIAASSAQVLLGYLTTRSGRRHQAELSKKTANAIFGDGLTVDVASVHATIAVVGAWVAALGSELGLRSDQILCDGIVSGPGDAVPMHFDAVETLCVQLTGRKHWRIAPYTSVAFPQFPQFPGLTHNFRDGRDPSSDEAPAKSIKKMPRNAQSFFLRPGSVCFLPRGWWHETRALKTSISLTFILRTDSWSQILTQHLQYALAEAPGWRAPVALATNEQREVVMRAVAAFMRSASGLVDDHGRISD